MTFSAFASFLTLLYASKLWIFASIYLGSPYQVGGFQGGGFLFLYSFVRRRRRAAAAGRRAWPPPHIPCHPDIYKTALLLLIWCSTYWIQVLIPKLHQLLKKFGKIWGSCRPSLIVFRQIRTLSPWYLQNRFFDSLCVQLWLQVLIPRLHQFFWKFVKIFMSWRLSLICFFVKLGPCHPDNFKAAYPIHSIFKILHSSINS